MRSIEKFRRKPTRVKVLWVAAGVATLAIIIWMLRRRGVTTESGARTTAGAPMAKIPISPGDRAPKQSALDDTEQRAILGLDDSEPISGEAMRAYQARLDLGKWISDPPAGVDPGWQGLAWDGKNGPMTRSVMRMSYWPIGEVRPVTNDELQLLAVHTAQWESNSSYDATATNAEFEGDLKGHAAEGEYSIGLSYGLIQFTQNGGALGGVLQLFHDRNPGAFRSLFEVCPGSADELLRMTNGPRGTAEAVYGMADGGRRNLRVRKICGEDLWRDPWLAAFKRAAKHPDMQWAQRQYMVDHFVRPAVEHGLSVGFCGRPEMAVLIDFTTHMGRKGMRDTVSAALAPYGGRAPSRAAIIDVIRQYRSTNNYRTYKVRGRRVRMLSRHNPSIGYC